MKKNVFLLMSFFLYACSEKTSNVDEQITTIEIDLEGGNTCNVKPDSIVELQIIPLEDKQEAMIKDGMKIKVLPQGYIIEDEFSDFQYRLLLFDHNGHFKNKIGEIGHGRGEYIQLIDFEVNSKGDTVFVIDDARRLLKYSLEGDFLGSFTPPEEYNGIFYSFHCLGDEYLLGKGLGCYELFDSNYNFVECVYDYFENDLPTVENDHLRPGGGIFKIEDGIIYNYSVYKSTLNVVNLHDKSYKRFILKSKNMASRENVLAKFASGEPRDFDKISTWHFERGILKGRLRLPDLRIYKDLYFNTNTGKFALYDSFQAFITDGEKFGDYYYAVKSLFELQLILDNTRIPAQVRQMYLDAYKALGRELTPENNHFIIKFKLADNEEKPL